MIFQKEVLHQFDEIQEIGKGQQGIIYKGKKENKIYAIKKIIKNQEKFKQIFKRYDYERETNFLKKFDHPNIIKFYDILQDERFIYLQFELMDNGDLKNYIQKNIRFTEQQACNIFLQILNGLNYLHNQNPPIIHRDLKPDNIMLNKNFEFKLVDFGTANIDNQKRSTLAGTPFYRAPEITENYSNYSKDVDIWSLGVILFELIAGIDENQDPFSLNQKIKFFYQQQVS